MANESTPDDPLPADFVPEGAVARHRVSDGEDWASVAAQYNVNVKDLIYFNFHTNIPEEVNWYLRRNTGCNVSNDGDLNWAFSSSADPGLIYIPPSEVIDMEPEEITAEKPVMQRIQEIADTLPGNPGIRIRKILAIESLADPYQKTPAPPGLQKDRLWYYNPAAVHYYIQLLTRDADRRGMTKDTNGQFPFDGNIGPGFEQGRYQEWRIYPFGDIVVQDANNPQSDSYLKIWLEGTEKEIHDSWEDMASVDARLAVGGGSVVSPLVEAFLKHVHDMANTQSHLYYIYQHDDDDS
jgi:hypothetical protein